MRQTDRRMPATLKHAKSLARTTERLGKRGDLQTNLTDLQRQRFVIEPGGTGHC